MATLQQLIDASSDHRLSSFIGKTALVGIYQFYLGEPVVRSQDIGIMTGIEQGMMRLQTKEEIFSFPILYEAWIPAPRGQYILHATGEKVHNPDFIISWRLDLADNLDDSQWQINSAPHFASIVGAEWDFEYTYDEQYIKALLDERANTLIGKTILAGLRVYEQLSGDRRSLVEQSQHYGVVLRANFSEGVVIRLQDGSEYCLPPDISMIQAAPPDEYTLQSTGEVIVNPDLMTMWTITR